MFIKLTGTVFNSRQKDSSGGYSKVPFAKVFISDEYGYETPKKIHTTTLDNGKFELSLPSTLVNNMPFPLIDGKYITASVGDKRVTVPISSKSNYDLDLKSAMYGSQEVTVSAQRPTPSEDNDKKWSPFKIAGIVLLASTIGYLVYKKLK